MTYPAHLEFFDLDDPRSSCSWNEWSGERSEVCLLGIEVMLVYPAWEDEDCEPGEVPARDILAEPFCRAHGNLALIEMREES